jgi:hypothetical protein
MTKPKMRGDFTSERQRSEWIQQHADTWTVVEAKTGRGRWKQEYPTREAAEAAAREMVKQNSNNRYLIYAVLGIYDTYVCTIVAGTS